MKLRLLFPVIWLGCCLLLLEGCSRPGKDGLPDMSRSFAQRSKKPMGTFMAHRMFVWQFHAYHVYINTKSFAELRNNIDGSSNLFFSVNNSLVLQEGDLDALLSFVASGNQLFLSSAHFDDALLDTLGVRAEYNSWLSVADSGQVSFAMQPTFLRLYNNVTNQQDRFGFYYYPLVRSFSSFDSSRTHILSFNHRGQPDGISFTYGDGRIFLHLHPEAFSNYFLLKNQNKEYVEQLLSYVSQNRKTVYWDDFYRMGLPPDTSFSSLGVFLRYPYLKEAFWLALLTIALYLLFGSKRKQRPIPVAQPLVNSSVSFVETIGRLYLQQKDHHNIVQKMVTYFLEQVRQHYFINTSQLNTAFFSALSRKSGVPQPEVERLFAFIEELQSAEQIGDAALLELNHQLQQYFKH